MVETYNHCETVAIEAYTKSKPSSIKFGFGFNIKEDNSINFVVCNNGMFNELSFLPFAELVDTRGYSCRQQAYIWTLYVNNCDFDLPEFNKLLSNSLPDIDAKELFKKCLLTIKR